MIAVLKHELSGYFHSLTAYIFGAFLLAFVGIGAMIYNIQQAVVGKYLALLSVYLFPMCIVSIYPLIFKRYGEVYLLTAYGSIAAFFMMGAALIAIGTFSSSLTENQGFAAGIAIPVILLNYYSVSLAEHVSKTALGSVVVLCILCCILGFIIRFLTKNEMFGIVVFAVMVIALGITYFFDTSAFEGLLPDT